VQESAADQRVAEEQQKSMNATRQTEDMALAWAEVQKKMWEQWMKGLESSVRPPQYSGAWERAASDVIDAWSASVKLALQAQLDGTTFWVRSLTADERLPKEVIEWAHQMLELMKAWNNAQREMWDAWFIGLRKFGPIEYTNAFIDVYTTWREAVRKSFDAEAAWMREWSQQLQRVSGNGTP
jgi:hypothetical protein